MKCNVPVAEAINDEAVLPERVQQALGQLVGAAKEGLLALVGGGWAGCAQRAAREEVDELVGPKGKRDPDRTAVVTATRTGGDAGRPTCTGQAAASEDRGRRVGGAASTYDHFADRDQLGEVVLERMLAGVSTRQYRRVQEPVGEELETDARSTSKSAVSRTFVHRTRDQLWD